MAGGSPEHAALAASVMALLVAQLRDKPCRVFSSDLRVRVQATGLATYPDVTVICGRLQSDPEDRRGHTALNPKVVIEVLSLSTEEYNRGEKLLHYREVPSIDEIVLIELLKSFAALRKEPSASSLLQAVCGSRPSRASLPWTTYTGTRLRRSNTGTRATAQAGCDPAWRTGTARDLKPRGAAVHQSASNKRMHC